jgi:hypothetical protein
LTIMLITCGCEKEIREARRDETLGPAATRTSPLM